MPTLIVNNQEVIATDDVASLFQVAVREDTVTGGLTVTYRGRSVVLSPDQAMASVNGRVISLPSAPVRVGRRWMVPIEFVPRALAQIYDARIELRREARLLVVGDVQADAAPAPPAAATAPAPVPGAPAPAAPATRAAGATPAGASGTLTVVVDAGHGGDDSGVRGAGGTVEKQITLDIARRLKAMVETRLGARVVLTRDDDRALTLDERTATANNSKADLFISLHANGSFSAAPGGAEIFTLRLDRDAESARQRAQGEQVAVPILGGGTRPIEVVRWDQAQARHTEGSTVLASTLEEELRKRVPLGPRPLRQAPLRVLAAASMPAVLVEVGYLTNENQAQAIAAEEFQSLLTQGLFDAIVRMREYLEGRRQ